MPLSPALKAALDKSAQEAWKKEQGKAASPRQPEQQEPPIGTSQELSPVADGSDAPPAEQPSLPPARMIITFDPNKISVEIENWERLTPGMIQRSHRLQVRELIRIRNVQFHARRKMQVNQ